MKASDVALLLRKISSILDCYGDMTIFNALDEIQSVTKENKRKSINTKNQRESAITVDLTSSINDDLIEKMSKMDSDELAGFIHNADVLKSKKALMILAEKLSITSSKRHSVEALTHFIVTYFEHRRMDDIIKNDRRQNE